MQTVSVKAHSSTRHAGAVALVLAAALAGGLLAACGGGGGAQSEVDSPPAATPLQRIVYRRNVTKVGGGTQADLYAVNEDGSGDFALASSQEDEFLAKDRNGKIVRIGDRIVYHRVDIDGAADLYSVKLDGTGTVALATSSGNERVIAVVGDHVLIDRYLSGGLVTLISVNVGGGDPVNLPSDAEFVAVSQGRIFYNSALTTGSPRLYCVLPDGTGTVDLLAGRGAKLLVNDPSNRNQNVNMTAGGRLLLSVDKELYITNSTATALTRLGTARSGDGLESWWTSFSRFGARPVGDRVAYVASDGSLYSVRLDGTASLLLAPPPSDGGMSIVGAVASTVIYQSIDAVGNPNGLLYAANVNGGAPSLLATAGLTAGAEVAGGDRVLLVGTSSGFELEATNLDGSARVILANAVHHLLSDGGTDPNVRYRALAAFGKRVVFRRPNGTVLNTYSINNDGTGLVTLVGGVDASDPEALSADRLFFRRVVDEQSDLYSILPDGTGLATLANGTTDERFGIFCGNKVVYTRLAADGHRDLLIVNGDGGGNRVLSSSPDDKQPLAVF